MVKAIRFIMLVIRILELIYHNELSPTEVSQVNLYNRLNCPAAVAT